MKHHLNAAVLTAMVGAIASSAVAATYNSDLIVGFTAQSGNDVIYDLGATSSLTDGKTWDFGAVLAGYNLNSIHWGVVGDKTGSPRMAWSTSPDVVPPSISGLSAWGQFNTAVSSIYSGFTTAGAGQSVTIASTDDNSWNQQTISGALTTQFHNAYGDPNQVGTSSSAFYSMAADNSAPVQLGSFALGSDGVLTYSVAAVPEPSAAAIFAIAGIAVFACNSRFRSKQA